MSKLAAVIMHSPGGDSYGERFVHAGREGALFDLVCALDRTGIEDIFIVTPENIAVPPARIVRPMTRPFHFGNELKRVLSRFKIDRLLYFGSGSGALLTATQLKTMIKFTARLQPSALLNNFYSCDFGAISRAQMLLGVHLPAIDNALGFALSDLGFSCFSLPRDLFTQFDIDTPTDLVLLAAAGLGGPHLRAAASRFGINHPKLPAFIHLLTSRAAHVYLIGRVNPHNWMEFEQGVACRTSALAEGRGMRAYPEGKGTILGQVIQRAGVDAFISQLSSTCDGAVIDTRPLLGLDGTLPPPADRFSSDLLRPDAIKNPLWRKFTDAVKSAKLPIILGGHSLLSGGLYLLPAIAWKGRDLPRRLHPETINWEKERP